MGMPIADDRPFQPSSDIQDPSITMECLVSLWYLANQQTWSEHHVWLHNMNSES